VSGRGKDLTGWTFGRLGVIERVGTDRGYVLWACVCVCRRHKRVTSGDLLRRAVRSCGCLVREGRPHDAKTRQVIAERTSAGMRASWRRRKGLPEASSDYDASALMGALSQRLGE
jgi:hypothetical protein